MDYSLGVYVGWAAPQGFLPSHFLSCLFQVYIWKQRDSLSDFKDHNGFQRVHIPRYCVPMTKIGDLAFRMGVHHKPIERHFEPLIEKPGSCEVDWYNHKMQLAQEK